MSIDGSPSVPGEQGAFVQFDSKKAKRRFAERLDVHGSTGVGDVDGVGAGGGEDGGVGGRACPPVERNGLV